MTTVYKQGMARLVAPGRVQEYLEAGWLTEPATADKPADQVIKLKAPAKSKGADKSLDNAINTGEE
jgi:hypothetical protein